MKILTSFFRNMVCVSTLLLAQATVVLAQEIEEYSGKIDIVDLGKRLLQVNDLPLRMKDDLVVYSKSMAKLNRYHLKSGQEVRVEFLYDSKSDIEVATAVYILE